jgi:hypothetical protein
MTNSFWKRSGLVLATTILVVAGTSISTPAQAQNQPPAPAVSRSDEMLKAWDQIGNKLVAMAQDFPETNTISRCRRTSAPLPRIFSTPPHWISS